MFYYLYEIRNNLNGKIYVGVHKTKDLNDGYMGSGKIIRSAINKHGISNFSKVILEYFDTSEAMYAREKEVVTEEFLSRDDVYNLRRGGSGGFDYINSNPEKFLTDKRIHALKENNKLGSAAWKEKYNSDDSFKKQHYETCKLGGYATYLKHGSYFSKLNIDPLFQAKVKERFKETQHQQGEKNSQFGTCWISHELVGSKKIKKELLPEFIEQGWTKGRNKFNSHRC